MNQVNDWKPLLRSNFLLIKQENKLNKRKFWFQVRTMKFSKKEAIDHWKLYFMLCNI